MSSIKIPDLNLYRGKRNQHNNQYEAIQKEGAFILAKSKNKELVSELKAQLYLDTYRANLNHFVSPSKYKERAEEYLIRSKQEQTLLMRAMSFPKARYHCPNCFYSQQSQRKCSCQIESKIPSIKRMKQREVKFQVMQNDQKQQPKNLTVQFKKTDIEQLELKYSPKSRSQEEKNISDPLILDLSKSEESQGKEVRQQIQREVVQEREKKRVVERGDNILSNLQFISDLNRHQNDLQNIQFSGEDSKSFSIDFTDLVQAKKQYIAQSRNILQSLDKILEKYPQKLAQ